GVAYRTARKAKRNAAGWYAREKRIPNMAAPDPAQEAAERDLRSILDEELNRLPAKYRDPVVLCYLEGHTNEEAARKLGCPCGTVATRLARARGQLRDRLSRRGVGLSAPALATALAEEGTGAVPAPLVSSTGRGAALFAAGKAAASGAVSGHAVALAEGVWRAMFFSKLKPSAALFLMVAILGSAGVALAYHGLT